MLLHLLLVFGSTPLSKPACVSQAGLFLTKICKTYTMGYPEKIQKRIDEGRCITCGVPKTAATLRCTHCTEKFKKTRSANIKDNLSNGLCKTCAKPRDTTRSKVYCSICADKMAELARKRRQRYDEDGLCTDCGQPRDNHTKLCNKCKNRRKR